MKPKLLLLLATPACSWSKAPVITYPRRAPDAVADAIEAFMLATDFAGRLS